MSTNNAGLAERSARAGGAFLREVACGPLSALVVLGSGLASALDQWGTPQARVRLGDIPGVKAPVALGHEDELRFYARSCGTVAVACGRTHLYEGEGPGAVVALAEAGASAGVQTAVLCNANGCLRDWQLGEVMAIRDHLNFSGASPFATPEFVDVTGVWDTELTGQLEAVCDRSGIYCFMRGPEYQTRAESRALSMLGADCVGMSTVLEAITLHARGVRVGGLSVVTDLSCAALPTTHEAVLEASKTGAATVRRALDAVYPR
ncbi:MAG: purine-nucleoside phosphorylase [Actinomycetaceae bacterium]|nr:purine-nucleoside phosphorylase [Actinomycetaceae bacterium]